LDGTLFGPFGGRFLRLLLWRAFPKASNEYVGDTPIHRSAHDERQDDAAAAHKGARHYERLVGEHETSRRGTKSGERVQETNADGHVAPTNGLEGIHEYHKTVG
jgi:hypothetical protein